MPKTITMAQAVRATGLSRHMLKRIAEQYDIGKEIKGGTYKKFLIDPEKLAHVVPITEQDIERAVKNDNS